MFVWGVFVWADAIVQGGGHLYLRHRGAEDELSTASVYLRLNPAWTTVSTHVACARGGTAALPCTAVAMPMPCARGEAAGKGAPVQHLLHSDEQVLPRWCCQSTWVLSSHEHRGGAERWMPNRPSLPANSDEGSNAAAQRASCRERGKGQIHRAPMLMH